MKNLAKYIKEYVNEGLKITADTEIEDFYDTPGVYAYFNDKTLSSDEDYIKKHKKDAIGVAVIAEVDDKLHKIVIDKTDIGKKYYGGYGTSITGATTITDKVTALKDMNGKANTIAISDACHGYDDDYRTGSVAEDCQARFNGQGYLPSLGEWKMLHDNKDEVDKMMALIDGNTIGEFYWSSTLYTTSTNAWYLRFVNGSTNMTSRSAPCNTRAIMEI